MLKNPQRLENKTGDGVSVLNKQREGCPYSSVGGGVAVIEGEGRGVREGVKVTVGVGGSPTTLKVAETWKSVPKKI